MRAGSQQCSEAGDICAICQADFREPIALLCQVRMFPTIKRLLKDLRKSTTVIAAKLVVVVVGGGLWFTGLSGLKCGCFDL